MKANDIIVGGEYAVIRSDYDEAFPSRVRVLEVGLHRQVHVGGRSYRTKKSARPDGVRVEHLDRADGSIMTDHFTGKPRQEVVFVNHIKRTWHEQVDVSIARDERKAKRAQDREELNARRAAALLELSNLTGRDFTYSSRATSYGSTEVRPSSVILNTSDIELIVKKLQQAT